MSSPENSENNLFVPGDEFQASNNEVDPEKQKRFEESMKNIEIPVPVKSAFSGAQLAEAVRIAIEKEKGAENKTEGNE